LHEELSTIAGSCLDLKNRVKQLEKQNQNSEKINNLEKIIESLNKKFQELANQKNFIDQHLNLPKPAMNEETVERLQVKLKDCMNGYDLNTGFDRMH